MLFFAIGSKAVSITKQWKNSLMKHYVLPTAAFNCLCSYNGSIKKMTIK